VFGPSSPGRDGGRTRLRVFEHGQVEEKKALLRLWVPEMKLATERREVVLTFRAPEPVMKAVVAGAGFEPATFGL